MNNIQSKINKLILALKYKGYSYKINTEQFYSEKRDKICTKYILYEDVPKNGNKFFTKIDLLKHLIELYKKVGENSG